MARSGKAKNTQNKAKHSKLVQRKKKKLRKEKDAKNLRIKELNNKINEQKRHEKRSIE